MMTHTVSILDPCPNYFYLRQNVAKKAPETRLAKAPAGCGEPLAVVRLRLRSGAIRRSGEA